MDKADANGVVSPSGTVTPRMYYYEGSQLSIEWTNQHGCGENPKLHCQMVIQYACEDTLTDNCGEPDGGRLCGPRDGTPITNDVNTANKVRDVEAAAQIDDSIEDGQQYDMRYGRHETLEYYEKCKHRRRNEGLFYADRNLNGNSARFTRQNNNGARSGLECPEEHDYFPYWHPSPWKDVAILTSREQDCNFLVGESQNTKEKGECDCPDCDEGEGELPNNPNSCTGAGGTWLHVPAHDVEPPYCGKAPHTRENHLGNPVGGGNMASSYNWTIPVGLVESKMCVLRLRYNISTDDAVIEGNADMTAQYPETEFHSVSRVGTSANSGDQTPIFDRSNSEPKAYKGFTDFDAGWEGAKLGIAMNTNQFGRVFEDRSYTFEIKPVPTEGECANKKIFNLNVRGKRGNIVQTYPSVEYDFTPNDLHVTDQDCIHVQWTGSDYNPNRAPNNGYGGPENPNNRNEAKADRHNIVQMDRLGVHTPKNNFEEMDLFDLRSDEDRQRLINMAFQGQDYTDATVCMTLDQIVTAYPELENNLNGRGRIHKKLRQAEWSGGAVLRCWPSTGRFSWGIRLHVHSRQLVL